MAHFVFNPTNDTDAAGTVSETFRNKNTICISSKFQHRRRRRRRQPHRKVHLALCVSLLPQTKRAQNLRGNIKYYFARMQYIRCAVLAPAIWEYVFEMLVWRRVADAGCRKWSCAASSTNHSTVNAMHKIFANNRSIYRLYLI